MTRGEAVDVALVVLTSAAAVVTTVLTSIFLPWTVGSVTVPASAVLGGVVLAALASANRGVREDALITWLPVIVAVVTVVVLLFGGPGGDVMFNSLGPLAVLVLCIVGIPGIWYYFRVFVRRINDITSASNKVAGTTAAGKSAGKRTQVVANRRKGASSKSD